MRKVNNYYYFTPETSPVVSGAQNAVTYTLDSMTGDVNTSYSDYSDLFNELSQKHISTDNMPLETVGNNATFPLSDINLTIDEYYAGMGPTNQTVTLNNTTYTQYSYVVILHVNQPPSDKDVQGLYFLESSNDKMGFTDYNVQVYDDYIVIQAHAPMIFCADDMISWNFLKYQTGS